MENLKQPSAQPNHEYVMEPDHSKWVWRAAYAVWAAAAFVICEEAYRMSGQKPERHQPVSVKPLDVPNSENSRRRKPWESELTVDKESFQIIEDDNSNVIMLRFGRDEPDWEEMHKAIQEALKLIIELEEKKLQDIRKNP